MSAHVTFRTTPGARTNRIDAEYYASPQRQATARMYRAFPDWLSIADISARPTSGATPKGHDLSVGTVPFITIDGIEPLWLDNSRSKMVTADQRDGELRRVRLSAGDVVVTIKRRICNAAVVGEDGVGAVVNQDVAVLRPTGLLEAEVIAAVLASQVGQSQATLLQTEQINPYLSVTSLKQLRFPRLSPLVREAIVAAVRERTRQLALAESEIRAASQLVATACGIVPSPAGRIGMLSLASVRAANRIDAEFFVQSHLEFQSGPSTGTLGTVTSRLSNGATPSATDYQESGYPIYKVAGLSRFGIADWQGDRVRPGAASARAARAKVQTGDVLILAAAHDAKYIGKSAVVQTLPAGEEECRVVGELVVARPTTPAAGPTLSAYLQVPAVRHEIRRLVRGQSAHVYPADLTHLPVPEFDLALVEQVNQRFDACEAARARSVERLTEARGLVDRAVLGV